MQLGIFDLVITSWRTGKRIGRRLLSCWIRALRMLGYVLRVWSMPNCFCEIGEKSIQRLSELDL